MIDENGGFRTFKIKALYVQACKVRLPWPNDLRDQSQDETLSIEETGIRLSVILNDPTREAVFARVL